MVSTDLEDDEPENFNNPAGWTLIGKRNTSGSTGLAQTGVWYRVAGASEPATYTFTWDTDGDAVGAVIRYSGVDTANPIDAWANDRGSSINPIAPDITTTVANTTVLRVFGSDDDDLPVPPTDVHPPSTTGRYELQTTGGESTTGAGADTTQATAGSTGTATFTLAGSEKWVAFTIALTPEPATPTTYYYVTEAYYQNWTSVYSNEAKANMVAILDAWTTGTTHAVSAGDDRLLLVGVYGEDSGAISSIADVTWGGQTLTPSEKRRWVLGIATWCGWAISTNPASPPQRAARLLPPGPGLHPIPPCSMPQSR